MRQDEEKGMIMTRYLTFLRNRKLLSLNFLQDRQARRYAAFLLLFCIGLIVIACIGNLFYGRKTKTIMMEREKQIVTALLKQDVSQEDIAAAFSNETITEDADTLMQKLGLTQQTQNRFWPVIRDHARGSFVVLLCIAVLADAALLSVSFLYLQNRERCYKQAENVISEFAEGNFEHHLGKEETGSLSVMYNSIEQLAAALQGRNETETKAKQFLQDTISDISHQLKTPLAAMSMYTEIILGEPDKVETVTHFAEQLMLSLERIDRIVQMMLKIMRLDAGSIRFDKRMCNAAELVNYSVSQLIERAKAEGKDLVLDVEESLKLYCDREWTAEAIGNLVKNALDHTEAGDTVKVRVTNTSYLTRIEVADTGYGIGEQDIYHIFKRFYTSSTSRGNKGAGLGLPLAKEIIEGQEGTLSVHSYVGEGSTFCIMLPKE